MFSKVINRKKEKASKLMIKYTTDIKIIFHFNIKQLKICYNTKYVLDETGL